MRDSEQGVGTWRSQKETSEYNYRTLGSIFCLVVDGKSSQTEEEEDVA